MIAVFYDGLVVPGALLLLGSGAWLIAGYHGGWAFLDRYPCPWPGPRRRSQNGAE